MERRYAGGRFECSRLGALEPLDRRLAGRAVHAHIGNLARPRPQMRLEASQLANERPAIAFRFT